MLLKEGLVSYKRPVRSKYTVIDNTFLYFVFPTKTGMISTPIDHDKLQISVSFW